MYKECMHLRALNFTFPGASAEVKFFIIQLLKCYKPCQIIEIPVKVLAKSLGVSDRVVSAGCAYLEAQGFLVRERAPIGGQAGYRMWLSEDVHLFIERHTAVAHAVCGPMVEWVLSLDSEDQPALVSTKLLLAVLLFNADSYCVVSGISRSRLSELTGMKKGRLYSQLSILQRAGYIVSNVAGVNGLRLFGKRSSVYFLSPEIYRSLERVTLIESVGIAELIFDAAAWFDDAFSGDVSDSIIKNYIENHSIRLPLSSDFEFIYDFFRDDSNGVQDYLQMKLEEYASLLMSRHTVKELKGAYVLHEDILENISLEFYSPIYFRRHRNPRIPAEVKYKLLVNFIYESSWIMAKTIVEEVPYFKASDKDAPQHSFGLAHKYFRVLPLSQTEYRLIYAVP